MGIAYNIKPTSDGAARLLRAHPGDAVQREPGAVQQRLLECRAVAAACLHAGRVGNARARLSATSSTPACSRPSASSSWSAASTSGSTPTTPSTSACWAILPSIFPIDWHNSKIPGYALNAEFPSFHHFSAYFVASSVAARFFPPQSAGAGATRQTGGQPFRIDHDEKFNQTTHLQYQFWQARPVGRIQLAL